MNYDGDRIMFEGDSWLSTRRYSHSGKMNAAFLDGHVARCPGALPDKGSTAGKAFWFGEL